MHVEDTIVALSSAPGPGARAIVRLSGPHARAVTEAVLRSSLPAARQCIEREVRLPGVHSALPVRILLWPGPRTYTGQDIVELHSVGCPPLVELLVAECLSAGARAAQPGEFTMRAFLAGKLDLTRAEAVLAVIDSQSRDELKQALAQLAGGVARPLQELRDDLLNLLADVEAGLDFTDEDIRFVEPEELLRRIARGLALVTLLKKQVDERSTGPRRFRAVLAGSANAGKSSLFNALAGAARALVSPQPGTTRDYLIQRLDIDGVSLDLIDTAGLRDNGNGVEADAQALGKEQAEQADVVLLCVEAGRRTCPPGARGVAGASPLLYVATKCDLAPPPAGWLATSAKTRQGLDELRAALAERVRAWHRPALAPSLSRCRHHVERCLRNLQAAHAGVLDEEPAEILALELRGALDALGEMAGAVYTDDLLDRIFSRFCIGK
jgi:tRNA modification GTPase